MSCENCSNCVNRRHACRAGHVACAAWNDFAADLKAPNATFITGDFFEDFAMYGPESSQWDAGFAKPDMAPMSLGKVSVGIGVMEKNSILVKSDGWCGLFEAGESQGMSPEEFLAEAKSENAIAA